jgi:hypothetical protein
LLHRLVQSVQTAVEESVNSQSIASAPPYAPNRAAFVGGQAAFAG